MRHKPYPNALYPILCSLCQAYFIQMSYNSETAQDHLNEVLASSFYIFVNNMNFEMPFNLAEYMSDSDSECVLYSVPLKIWHALYSVPLILAYPLSSAT